MALVKCAECGQEVSTLAAACPHCGCPKEAFANPAPPEEPVDVLLLECGKEAFATPAPTKEPVTAAQTPPTAKPTTVPQQLPAWRRTPAGVLVVIWGVALLALLFGSGLVTESHSGPAPERCSKCGAKIGWADRGGNLCGPCAKEIDDLREAAERLKYLRSKDR